MSVWDEHAETLRRESRDLKLTILVWGPGNPGKNPDADKLKAYNKRIQIMDQLRAEFRNCTVNFSEDAAARVVPVETAKVMDRLNQQAPQARMADAIIVLALSRGSDLELDYFITEYPWFRDKVYVLLPKGYIPKYYKPNAKDALVRDVFDYLKPQHLIGFTPKDFDTCKVATRKAVAIAEAVAMNKMLKSS